jgi:hypothetical protein
VLPVLLVPLLRPRSAFIAVVTTLAFGAAGCRCKDDHPYVPYTIGSSSRPSATAEAPPAPSASQAPLPVDGGTFPRVIAQQAPPGTSTWTLGGLSIAAPPGRVFLVGLPMTTPGQPAQVAAFVGDGGSMAGEVVLYRADAGGRVVGPTIVARLPDWLPVGQDCVHMPQLSQIGPTTLWLDMPSVCHRNEPTRKPNRYLAALSASATPGVRAELRVADPAPGERLAIDADGADLDSDGADDLLVQIALEGAPTPLTAATRVTAQLRFLGRAAGMSRDTQEPGQSLRSIAAWQASQAARKETAEHALTSARQIRRLDALLCAEGGAPAITLADGTGIPCADGAAIDDARFAEARALVTLGNMPAAFPLAARLREAKGKAKRAAELDAAIEAQATVRKVSARPLKLMPRVGSVALPMAFDPQGNLLVLAEDGSLVRVDPASGQESPADGPRWTPLAELVGDLKVSDVIDPCRADFLRVRVKGASIGNRDLTVFIPGGSAPGCVPEGALPPQLIDRNGDGLTALVQGEPVTISSDGERAQIAPWPATPGGGGSIRSPDGRWTAIAAPDRVLLRGPDKPEVWRPTVHFSLTSCTVANEAKAVACLLERGIVVLTR